MSNLIKFCWILFIIFSVISVCLYDWDYFPAYKYEPNCWSTVFSILSLLMVHNVIVYKKDERIQELESRCLIRGNKNVS